MDKNIIHELYELMVEWGKRLLYGLQGKEALNYLTADRGYKEENLRETEWIYFPPDWEIRRYLESKADSRGARDLSLQGYYGDHFRLAFPYRNRSGIITGLVKRSTTPKGSILKGVSGVRYDATKGLRKHDLFNLHSCKDERTLLITEGYPDALYLPTLGLKNIVAVGQGLLSRSHLEGLKEFDIERVIIAFDNDPVKFDESTGKGVYTGIENTKRAMNLLASETNIEVFVLDPPSLSPHKDPDEFVRAKGVEAFGELMKDAQVAAEWGKSHPELFTFEEKVKEIQKSDHFSVRLREIVRERYRDSPLLKKVEMVKQLPIDQVAEALNLELDGGYHGLCPEGHPSEKGKCFSLNLDGNYFYCFHCGKGGDAVKLVQITMKRNFQQSVEWLWNEFFS